MFGNDLCHSVMEQFSAVSGAPAVRTASSTSVRMRDGYRRGPSHVTRCCDWGHLLAKALASLSASHQQWVDRRCSRFIWFAGIRHSRCRKSKSPQAAWRSSPGRTKTSGANRKAKRRRTRSPCDGAQFGENVAYHSRAITSNDSSFVLLCCLANRRSAAGSTPEASFARSSSQRCRAAFSATAGKVPRGTALVRRGGT